MCYRGLALFRVRKPCVGAMRPNLLSVGLKGHPHTLSHTPGLCKEGFANLHSVCSHLRLLTGRRVDAGRTTEEKRFCWSEWCICPAADTIMLPSPKKRPLTCDRKRGKSTIINSINVYSIPFSWAISNFLFVHVGWLDTKRKMRCY